MGARSSRLFCSKGGEDMEDSDGQFHGSDLERERNLAKVLADEAVRRRALMQIGNQDKTPISGQVFSIEKNP